MYSLKVALVIVGLGLLAAALGLVGYDVRTAALC
jgi:hypothetical protein